MCVSCSRSRAPPAHPASTKCKRRFKNRSHVVCAAPCRAREVHNMLALVTQPELGTSSAGAAQPRRAAPPGAGEARPDDAAAATPWTALSLLLLHPTDPCASPTAGTHGAPSVTDKRGFGAGASMRPASELRPSGVSRPGCGAVFAAASRGSRAARGWRTSGSTACSCTSAQQAPSPQAASHVSQTMWMPHQTFAYLRDSQRHVTLPGPQLQRPRTCRRAR